MNALVIALFLIVCVLLIIVVLLQKGRGSGLSGAFGGVGQTAFGTRIGDVFTWITIILAAVFLLLAIAANKWFHPRMEQIGPLAFAPPGMTIEKITYVSIIAGPSKAEIYYTIDETEPTRRSRHYVVPVPIGPGTTLKARAYRSAWKPSDVATAVYPMPPPIFSPDPGPIAAPLEVTITCAAEGARIYYTTDGSTPTEKSRLYSQSIRVAPGGTIKARAYLGEGRKSEMAIGEYPLKKPSPGPPATAPASAPAR